MLRAPLHVGCNKFGMYISHVKRISVHTLWHIWKSCSKKEGYLSINDIVKEIYVWNEYYFILKHYFSISSYPAYFKPDNIKKHPGRNYQAFVHWGYNHPIKEESKLPVINQRTIWSTCRLICTETDHSHQSVTDIYSLSGWSGDTSAFIFILYDTATDGFGSRI